MSGKDSGDVSVELEERLVCVGWMNSEFKFRFEDRKASEINTLCALVDIYVRF